MADPPEYRPDPPAERLRWDRILAWRSRSAVAETGDRAGSGLRGDGIHDLSHVTLSDSAAGFVAMLYDEQVVVGFDWPSWMEARGRELSASRALIAGSSLEECRMLLCALVRADRFNDGALSHALHDGLVDAVLLRAESLMAT